MTKRFRILGLIAGFMRLLSGLVDHWKIIALVGMIVSPIGPHIRWEYEYIGAYREPHYVHCTYLGSRGFVTPNIAPNCPFVTIIDTRGLS